MAVVGEHHPAFEEYCECIFELAEDDVDVIQARIAERLNVSRPAVSEMMRRLETEGLIETTDGHPPHRRRPGPGDQGRPPPPPRRAVPHRRPAAVVGRGPPRGGQVGARHERGRRERHGSPPRQPDDVPARQPDPRVGLHRDRTPVPSPPSASATASPIRRITEELEFTPGLLEYLEASALQPGHAGTITAASPDGTMTVEIEGRHVGVGRLRQRPHPGHARDRPGVAPGPPSGGGAPAGSRRCRRAPRRRSIRGHDGRRPTSSADHGVRADRQRPRELLDQLAPRPPRSSDRHRRQRRPARGAGPHRGAVGAGPPGDRRRSAPELLGGFDTVIDLVRRSVERRRPADADKAHKNLLTLIAAYDALSGVRCQPDVRRRARGTASSVAARLASHSTAERRRRARARAARPTGAASRRLRRSRRTRAGDR